MAMFREKIATTLLWTVGIVAAAMAVDYTVSILVLRDYAGYTPVITLFIATTVSLPVVYAFVSGRAELRQTRDALISTRDAAENALKSADDARRKAELDRARAVEASRAKSEFLANMSHELRTPLNAILGFSEMLSSDVFAERRKEYADLIHESGKHLLGLVNEVLDLSRIEAKKVVLHDEIVDIAELIRGCKDVLAPRATEIGSILVLRINADVPLVVGDRRALRQIVLNLLSNAIKFTDAGKSIELFAQCGPNRGLSFGVKDEGVGIPEEEQARMFERFGQGRHDITHALQGTGLGLPIVKGLAEAHGGRVSMQSRVGTGTCVTIWLPPDRLIPAKTAAA
jgi:two-component system, cell cycle sensor histidine kinase PleC